MKKTKLTAKGVSGQISTFTATATGTTLTVDAMNQALNNVYANPGSFISSGSTGQMSYTPPINREDLIKILTEEYGLKPKKKPDEKLQRLIKNSL